MALFRGGHSVNWRDFIDSARSGLCGSIVLPLSRLSGSTRSSPLMLFSESLRQSPAPVIKGASWSFSFVCCVFPFNKLQILPLKCGAEGRLVFLHCNQVDFKRPQWGRGWGGRDAPNDLGLRWQIDADPHRPLEIPPPPVPASLFLDDWQLCTPGCISQPVFTAEVEQAGLREDGRLHRKGTGLGESLKRSLKVTALEGRGAWLTVPGACSGSPPEGKAPRPASALQFPAWAIPPSSPPTAANQGTVLFPELKREVLFMLAPKTSLPGSASAGAPCRPPPTHATARPIPCSFLLHLAASHPGQNRPIGILCFPPSPRSANPELGSSEPPA